MALHERFGGWRVVAFVVVVGFAWLLGCQDAAGPRPRPSQGPSTPLIVSAPVMPPSVASGAATARLVGGDSVVFVSAPPGSFPGGAFATIRNRATGSVVTTPVIDGGFDPVPVNAVVGDSLAVIVTSAAGASLLQAVVSVRGHQPPVVVRTTPPDKKTDVPVNSVMSVVFSEPVDPGTINSGTIGLQLNSQLVAGGASILSDGLHATFAPDAPLAPQTTYTLVITTGVADLAGRPLEQPVQVPFTTGSLTSNVATITLFPSSALVGPGGSVQIQAVLRDASGNVLDWFNPAAPSLSWSTADPVVAIAASSGLLEGYLSGTVTGRAAGTVTVTATSGSRSATASITVGTLAFASVSTGDLHTCGITTTGEAYCWGSNLYGGALGTGDSSRDLVTTTPVRVAGGLSFATITAGTARTCGITTVGVGYCWGDGRRGALGNGDTVNSAVPVPVAGGLSLATISMGLQHACGLMTSGAAYCWGYNGDGELGTGTTSFYSATPVAVSGGFSFVQIAAGMDHTCALTASGAAYCWGSGSAGQLGTGDTNSAPTPVPVAGGLSFKALTAGFAQTCALTLAGTAYCWGVATAGLGVDTTSGCFRATRCTTPTPVVGGLTFSALGPASRQPGYSVCAVTVAGAAYCWGEIWGAGAAPREFGGHPSYTPQAVGGGVQFASVSLGEFHYCGLSVAGVAYCWGGNNDGQIGDGSFFIASDTPVKVAGQP